MSGGKPEKAVAIIRRIVIILFAAIFISGCQTVQQDPKSTGKTALTQDGVELASLEPVTDEPELASLEPVTEPSNPSAAPSATPTATPRPSPSPTAKDANWTIQVDDTQTVTQEETGILFHYNLYVYAQKEGGTDVLGNYKGQIVLKVEVDGESLAELMDDDGLTLDSASFNYQIETSDAVFAVIKYTDDAYTDGMKLIAPDKPLLQLPIPNDPSDAMVAEAIEMTSHMAASSLTGHDDSGNEGWGSAPGHDVTKPVPIVMTIEGASVYILFPNNLLSRAYKGTVTGQIN